MELLIGPTNSFLWSRGKISGSQLSGSWFEAQDANRLARVAISSQLETGEGGLP